ncbi:uncharacterized protein [Engystomops pustulosus]|uniref:uncharacterized protein isoform X2 n=1 Tax=Engystomops pustulosus TaxID=76066 RepID=UPI003AFA4F4C
MDEDRNQMVERIVSITLEILHLLTGEDYIMVKKVTEDGEGWSMGKGPLIRPPPHSYQMVLELSNKICKLLTGEVHVRCQDVAVYFSMEEWEYIEGHKDLYPDFMMEDPRTRTSQDGSSSRNPPERCSFCLYSQDDSKETPNVPENHQGEDGTRIIAEAEKERMRSDHPCKREVVEDIPGGDTTESPIRKENFTLLINYKAEEEEVIEGSTGDTALSVHPGPLGTDLSCDPPNHEEPSPHQSQTVTTSIGQTGVNRFQCGECGKQFTSNLGLFTHRRCHVGAKLYSCSECGKCFTYKLVLDQHQKSHAGGKPYTCSLCGNCFTTKSSLVTHEKIHSGEKPHSCSECGKCFILKSSLVKHQRSHTGEKPYTCAECGRCFTEKTSLVKHERIHTGEKPYSCALCGKSFTRKSGLNQHERRHKGEKLHSCLECGKCFTDKPNLVKHERIHTGEKPFSCSECGKCFTNKSHLVLHERNHTGEKPYSCSDCGKCFKSKEALVRHEKIHTGEKPFSCSQCGRCFTQKSHLVKHEKFYMERECSCS